MMLQAHYHQYKQRTFFTVTMPPAANKNRSKT
jgi:hypothetical protein